MFTPPPPPPITGAWSIISRGRWAGRRGDTAKPPLPKVGTIVVVSPEAAELLEVVGDGPLDVRLKRFVEERKELLEQVGKIPSSPTCKKLCKCSTLWISEAWNCVITWRNSPSKTGFAKENILCGLQQSCYIAGFSREYRIFLKNKK